MHLRSWTFRVQAETRKGQVVGVTGDVPQLGDWKTDSSSTIVLLALDPTNPEGDHWVGTTWLPQSIDVHYRYYIAVMVEDKVVISQREVSLIPRRIEMDGTFGFSVIRPGAEILLKMPKTCLVSSLKHALQASFFFLSDIKELVT